MESKNKPSILLPLYIAAFEEHCEIIILLILYTVNSESFEKPASYNKHNSDQLSSFIKLFHDMNMMMKLMTQILFY
jgi:hypothetical protein